MLGVFIYFFNMTVAQKSEREQRRLPDNSMKGCGPLFLESLDQSPPHPWLALPLAFTSQACVLAGRCAQPGIHDGMDWLRGAWNPPKSRVCVYMCTFLEVGGGEVFTMFLGFSEASVTPKKHKN